MDRPERCYRPVGDDPTPGSSRRRGPGVGAVDRHQAGPTHQLTDVRRRVGVLVADSQPEEELRRRTGDLGSGNHDIARDDPGAREPTVGVPPPARQLDDHVARPGDLADEDDRAGSGRAHPTVAVDAVLDPPIAGAPRAGRRPERIDHHAGDRRSPARRGVDAARHHQCGTIRHRSASTPHALVVRIIGPPLGTTEQRSTCVRARCAEGSTVGQPTPAADRRERRCSTDLVWICETRLSVTPRTWPISARVRPSS